MTVADELKPLSLGQTPPQTSTADGPPEAPQLLSEPETPRAAVPLGAQKADPSPSPPLARPWLPCGAGSWKLVLALCAGQTPPGSPGGAAGAAWARLCPGTGCRRHGGLGCRLCSDSGESPCSRGGGGRVSHGHRHFPPPPQTPQSPAPPGGLLAHGITGNQRKPAGRQPCRTPGNPLIAQQSRADSSAPPGGPPHRSPRAAPARGAAQSEGVLDVGGHQHQHLPDLLLPVGDVLGHGAPQLPVPRLGVLAAPPHLLPLLLQGGPGLFRQGSSQALPPTCPAVGPPAWALAGGMGLLLGAAPTAAPGPQSQAPESRPHRKPRVHISWGPQDSPPPTL